MKIKHIRLLLCTLVGFLVMNISTYAFESLDSLQLQIKNSKSKQAEHNADLLIKLSWEYRRRSADSTILYAKEALIIANKNNYLEGEAGALKNIGIGYSIQGKMDSALFYMEASLEAAKKLKDAFLIGRNLNNLGLTHHKQGNYEVALDYYLQSLEISERIGDATGGVTLMNIGLIQQKTEDYENASINFKRALTYAKKENNPTRISSCLYNIGSVYHQRKEFNQARNYYQKALQSAEKNEDLLLSAKILLSAGRVFRAEENYEAALPYFKEGYEIASKINDPETIAQTWSELAFISYQKKDYKKSLKESLLGLKIAESIESKEVQKNLLRLLSDNYAGLKRYKEAFDVNQKFIQISDELFNSEKSRKINALQMSKKIQEKENEVLVLKEQKIKNQLIIKSQTAKYSIAFLAFLLALSAVTFLYVMNRSQRNKNKDLKKSVAMRTRELELANIDLRNSNEELERFAFITSHDLKEPLRNISGFTGLLKRKLKGDLDEEGQSYIKYVQNSTKQMHQLIEDVLEYSRIGKQEENVDAVDLNRIFQEVCGSLPKDLADKKKDILKHHLPTIEGIRPHLYLIFENLIENALKYNKNEISRIEIRAKEHSNYWLFSVKDNGIGINKEFLEQIFVMFKRLHNREDYSGTGLGLAIVKKVIERAGGRIWVESTIGVGTTFFFTLPGKIN